MSWFSTSSLAAVRAGMWNFLLFAGAAWLAIAWSVLRLEPAGVGGVAGAVVLFGAVTEAVRALAGNRTWWLNAGMSLLFLLTAVLILADRGSTFTTTSALIGWYLMVRGAVDVAVSTINRGVDRAWGLMMVVGVLQVALGFYAASAYSRTAETVVLALGALALLRGVADLVAGLLLRESAGVAEGPREKAAGLAGYAAGLADYAAAATVRSRPRHRATGLLGARSGSAAAPVTAGLPGTADVPGTAEVSGAAGAVDGDHEPATADLDAMLALAGVSGAATTMFTGPHHADGAVRSAARETGADGALTQQLPAVTATVAGSGGATHGTAESAAHGAAGGTASGATRAVPDGGTAAGGEAPAEGAGPGPERAGGLAVLTARLFGKGGRDTH